MTVKTISNNELKQYSEEITDTCFLKIEKEGNKGVIFFKAGQIINACLNNVYGKNKADEILTWNYAQFSKIKIDTVSKFQSEDLKNVFDIIEFIGISADIYIKQSGQILVLSFSEGYLISVMPETSVTKIFINNLLSEKNKTVKMKLTTERTGELKIFISEFLDV